MNTPTLTKRYVVFVTFNSGKMIYVESNSKDEALSTAKEALRLSRGQASVTVNEVDTGKTIWES